MPGPENAFPGTKDVQPGMAMSLPPENSELAKDEDQQYGTCH